MFCLRFLFHQILLCIDLSQPVDLWNNVLFDGICKQCIDCCQPLLLDLNQFEMTCCFHMPILCLLALLLVQFECQEHSAFIFPFWRELLPHCYSDSPGLLSSFCFHDRFVCFHSLMLLHPFPLWTMLSLIASKSGDSLFLTLVHSLSHCLLEFVLCILDALVQWSGWLRKDRTWMLV